MNDGQDNKLSDYVIDLAAIGANVGMVTAAVVGFAQTVTECPVHKKPDECFDVFSTLLFSLVNS